MADRKRLVNAEPNFRKLRFADVPTEVYLSFGHAGLGWEYCDLAGFYAAEADHVWSSSHRCRIHFGVSANIDDYQIELDMASIIPVGCLSNTAVVAINDKIAENMVFERSDSNLDSIAVSAKKTLRAGLRVEGSSKIICISIDVESTTSPAPDPRCVGIMLLGVKLKSDNSQPHARIVSETSSEQM